MTEFKLNGKVVKTSAPDDTPLLWIIRDEFKLKGTKFGCGIAMCGACTVHLNGNAIRSCSYPVSLVNNAEITTIEGLNNEHPVQQAWVEEQVPQCGYCQSGQIMQAVSLLDMNPSPSDEDIANHMNSNLCRCMAYRRIQKAVRRASNKLVVQNHVPDSSRKEEA